jgi:hypothetical protein
LYLQTGRRPPFEPRPRSRSAFTFTAATCRRQVGFMSHVLRLSLVAFAAGGSLVWLEPRKHTSARNDQGTPSSLTGTWVLNAERTERPRDQTLGDPEETGGGAAVGMGSRRRPGASDNAPTASRSPQLTAAQRAFIGELLQPAESLLITQTDTALTIDYATGYLLRAPTNGRAVDEPQPDGTVNKTKATRRNTEIIVERDLNLSGSTREVYRLDPNDPRILTVEFRYEHKRQRRTFTQKRVYELKS